MSIETPEERIATVEEFTHAVISIVRTITIRNGEEWMPCDQIKQMLTLRDAAILREVADAGESELFELTRPYREQMAKCQAENDLLGYDHAYRVVQDMRNGGHAYVRAIRKLLKEHAAIVGKDK